MIVFFGTSRYSAEFLALALKNGLQVDLVVAAPPKSTGRKQVLTENPVVLLAKEKQIPFVLDLSELDFQLKEVPAATVGLMLDFNRLIPRSVIGRFEKGIINIHFSKLPQYRGPAPVQATILHGDKEAGITYFLITEKLDEGPILAQTSLLLEGTETTSELYRKLVEKATQEAPKIALDYLNNKIIPMPQKGPVSDTKKLTTNEAKIDWNKPAEEIERLIRASSSEPGAWTKVRTKNQQLRMKVIKAHLENGQLVLDTVQLEGKNPVSWKQFKEGYPEAETSQ